MILIAMPAYNEERFIAKTILGAKRYSDSILVVDDGSSDLTSEISQALGANVIVHEINKGYGGALKTIFTEAFNQDADFLVIIDADGQHNPEEIPMLLNSFKLSSCDLVIGSRFLNSAKKSIPLYRKFGMKILDTATNMAASKCMCSVSDSQSGFRAYNKKAIRAIAPNLSGDDMSAGSEILLLASEAGLQLCEVPIKVRYDIEDTSSENPVKHGLSVLSKIVGFISFKKPLYFFGLPGGFLCLLGFLAGLYTVGEYHTAGTFHYVVFLLAILIMVFGMLLFTSGLILNSIVRLMNSNNHSID
ncbi:glycosyltransferase family 2 protein [Methanomicrobium antiquum]|uniref:Glycosyltransferase family 2 protein n=1 Tax=Methanomicrobium antiquum TaxID=487686 RepID=A0AAF0FRY3_9EURY|nr:glycosyltransferase family 2 protein [Methanomicrobium antiquum]WFN37394.1 glycosyltransferase family 2 protein [Methanomicrobium antiquum]